jgi:ATP-dependent Clp protease ATP-binding subunit ClpX
MYDLPSREDIGKVIVDAAVVLEQVNPTLVPRVAETKTAKPRRAAS